jgi:hypothetical protein
MDSGDSPWNGRKIFASYSSDKALYSRMYKELNKLTPKESTSQ